MASAHMVGYEDKKTGLMNENIILKKKSIYAFKRYITYNLYSFFYNHYKKNYFRNRGKLIDVINVSNIFLLA